MPKIKVIGKKNEKKNKTKIIKKISISQQEHSIGMNDKYKLKLIIKKNEKIIQAMNTHKDLDDQFDENKKYIHQLDDNRYPILFTNKIFAKKMSPHIKETIFYAPNKYSQNSLQKNFEKSYGEGNFVYEHVKPIEYLSRYRQNNEMLIKYLPSKGKHWFSKCNIEKFKKQIMGKNCQLYEIIPSDVKRKVYFDIEKEFSNDVSLEEKDSAILARAKEKIKFMFGEKTKMAISTGSRVLQNGKKKVSFHIVLVEWYFENMTEQNKYFKGLMSSFKSTDDYFDSGVYGRNQCFRSVNQSKPKQKPLTMITYKNNIEHHIVQCVDLNIAKDASVLNQRFKELTVNTGVGIAPILRAKNARAKNAKKKTAAKTKKATEEKINTREQMHRDYAHLQNICILKKQEVDEDGLPTCKISANNSKQVELLMAIKNSKDHPLGYDLHRMIMGWFKKERGKWEDFQKWEATYDGQEKSYMTINDWNKVDLKLQWGRYRIIVLLKIMYGGLPNYYLKHQKCMCLKKSSNLSCIKVLKDKDCVQGKYIDAEYIKTLSTKHILLATMMGTGKTECVLRTLKQKYKNKKIIWITCRVSLAQGINGRAKAKHFKFDYYKDFMGNTEKSIEDSNRLIIELESLHKVSRQHYDVVILDENESILNVFLSDETHGNNYDENYITFENILRGCKQAFWLDAYMSLKSVKYIRLLDKSDANIKVLFKETDKIHKKIVYHKDFYTWFEAITTIIKNGGKPYIYYPYKTGRGKNGIHIEKLGEAIADYCDLRDDEYEVYFGGMDGEKKKALVDCDKAFSPLKFVLTNSVITVGVSYNNKDFTKIFVMYDDMIKSRDVAQTTFRIRETLSCEIEFYYASSNEKSATAAIKNELKRKLGIDQIKNKNERYNALAYIHQECKIVKRIPKKPNLRNYQDYQAEGMDMRPFNFLREELTNEYYADGIEMLMFYFQLAGYDITRYTEAKGCLNKTELELFNFVGKDMEKFKEAQRDIHKEKKLKYFGKVMTQEEKIAEYESIPLLDEGTAMELRNLTYTGDATKEQQLQVEKFFNETFWKTKGNKCNYLTFENEHLRDGLKSLWNGSQLLKSIIIYDEAPGHPEFGEVSTHYKINKLKLTARQRSIFRKLHMFDTRNKTDCSDYIVKKKIGKTYFGMNIIKRDETTREYVFAPKFMTFLEDVCQYSVHHKDIREWSKNHNLDFELESDEEEEEVEVEVEKEGEVDEEIDKEGEVND